MVVTCVHVCPFMMLSISWGALWKSRTYKENLLHLHPNHWLYTFQILFKQIFVNHSILSGAQSQTCILILCNTSISSFVVYFWRSYWWSFANLYPLFLTVFCFVLLIQKESKLGIIDWVSISIRITAYFSVFFL